MDTLYDLITYVKPENNILIGSQFITNKLFRLEYDHDNSWPYKYINIVPNDKRIPIVYTLPFHVFISDNKGKVICSANASSVSIDFKYLENTILYLPNKICIKIDEVNITQEAYGVYIDSGIYPYDQFMKNSSVVTLYITLLREEPRIH